MMFFLIGSISHRSLQISLADTQGTVTSLPFELAFALIHFVDGIRACPFQVTDTVGYRQFWRDRDDDMNMIVHIPRGVNF